MPKVGDRIRGPEIGRSDRWYIWVECVDCNAGRWVQDNAHTPKRCRDCATNIQRAFRL
jgi:ribosomal protein S27E